MVKSLAEGKLKLFAEKEGGPNSLLFGGLKRTSQIDVQLRFENGRYQYSFSLEPARNSLVFADEYLFPAAPEYIGQLDPAAFSTPEGGVKWAPGHREAYMAYIGSGEFASYALPRMRDWHVYHFLDTSARAPIRQAQPVRDNKALKSDGGNLAPYLRGLRERFPDHYRKIVETVKLAAPFFDDFFYRERANDRVELEWLSGGDSETILGPHQLSDGTLRFICLAVLLLQPADQQPRLILIDEPELGLHPFALTLLAEMLRNASHVGQVIVSTQSASLVSEFDPEDVVVGERKENASTFARLDGEKLRDWLEEYELGKMWKMNIFGGRPTR